MRVVGRRVFPGSLARPVRGVRGRVLRPVRPLGALAHAALRRFGDRALWLLPACGAAWEALLGAPWWGRFAYPLSLAYAEAFTPLARWAAWSGMTAVTFALVLCAVLVHEGVRRRRAALLGAAILLAVVPALWPAPREEGRLRVALVQSGASEAERLAALFDRAWRELLPSA